MPSRIPKIDFTELSREISYALRHAPERYGLELDVNGWASVGVLLEALRQQKKYQTLSRQDIEDMILCSEKKRHELAGNRIRALYGHSVKTRIQKEAERPPAVLYHGTAKRFLTSILEDGLKPMKRQYVHLTEEQRIAEEVGRRRDDIPVILCIDAVAAWKDGIRFYPGNDKVWLSDRLPARYIAVAGAVVDVK